MDVLCFSTGAHPMDKSNTMMPPHSAGPGWNDPPPFGYDASPFLKLCKKR